MKKKTVALLCGGISSEREVSLNSGDQVYAALDKEKYTIRRYDPKTDLPRLVEDAPAIDVALIILHGAFGEDGTVQGMLELLDIPYQGSGVLGSAVAMDKLATKQLYETAGIPVPPYIIFHRGDAVDVTTCVQRIGLPMVIKPAKGGSSIGMSIITSGNELENALTKAWEHDEIVVVEAFIEGTELTCGVMGNDDLEAFPLIEIIPDKAHAFFNYEAKYTPGATREICPARIDDAVAQRAQTLGKLAHRALFCQGYSRTDIMLKGRDLYVLETNTIPGMTETSLLPQAAKVAGYSFTQLLDKLIKLGIEGKRKKR